MKIEFPSLQLELDEDRGVLYIHDKNVGNSVVRICGLNKERIREKELSKSVDITFTEKKMLVQTTDNIFYNKDNLILDGEKVIFPEE